MPEHMVTVATDTGATRADCSCGWLGPDRADDPHENALLMSDITDHCHEVGVACPATDTGWCRDCSRAGVA